MYRNLSGSGVVDCCGPAGPPPRWAEPGKENAAAQTTATHSARHGSFMAQHYNKETSYGTVNPLKTHVAPAVMPNPGSREVRPRRSAASSRTVPRVKRPPSRTVERLSVPAGAVPLAVDARPFNSPT